MICITACLLDYICFKEYYKMIEIDLSKPQALVADPEAMQQINLTRNLCERATIFLIAE